MKKILISIFCLCLSFAYAFDASDFSADFSSRSLIMKSINNQDAIPPEKKELLQSKKLAPVSSCLIQQIKKGKIDNVRLLLEAKTDPNKNYMTEYPIYVAAKENKSEIVKLLYEYGAKLDKGFNSELYEAIKNKNKELAMFLIENGAKTNYRDMITGNSVLYLSLKNKMYDVSEILIEKGAPADAKSVKYIKKKKLVNLIK